MGIQKKVIAFNGPPGSGKDTLANIAIDILGDAVNIQIKEPLLKLAQVIYRLSDEDMHSFEVYEDKDSPSERFQGLSYRQALIELGTLIKSRYGDNFFISNAVDKIDEADAKYFIISDMGYDEEAEYLARYYDYDLIRLSRDSKYSFARDNRDYIFPKMLGLDNVREHDLENYTNDTTEAISYVLDILLPKG